MDAEIGGVGVFVGEVVGDAIGDEIAEIDGEMNGITPPDHLGGLAGRGEGLLREADKLLEGDDRDGVIGDFLGVGFYSLY